MRTSATRIFYSFGVESYDQERYEDFFKTLTMSHSIDTENTAFSSNFFIFFVNCISDSALADRIFLDVTF